MTPEEIAQLYSSVDYNKLNEEFAKLINEHRASLGLKSLEYRSEYREGSEYIAKELADYGYIVPEGQRPHTLPGTEESNLAVFKKELGHTHIGENLTYHYNRNNPYTIVSEKYLAEKMFDNWMNSEGHRELMEKDYYTGFSFAVYPSMYGNTMIADEAPNGWLENYEKAPEHLGLGIMGQLVLMTHP